MENYSRFAEGNIGEDYEIIVGVKIPEFEDGYILDWETLSENIDINIPDDYDYENDTHIWDMFNNYLDRVGFLIKQDKRNDEYFLVPKNMVIIDDYIRPELIAYYFTTIDIPQIESILIEMGHETKCKISPGIYILYN